MELSKLEVLDNWRLPIHQRFKLHSDKLAFQSLELINIKTVTGIDGGVHVLDRETGEIIMKLNHREVESSYYSDSVWERLEERVHEFIVMRMRFQGKLPMVVWC